MFIPQNELPAWSLEYNTYGEALFVCEQLAKKEQ